LPFVLRKLHSLAGVVPVGLFLSAHLWTNAAALGGQTAYERRVAAIQNLVGLAWIEIFGIALPLGFHAAWGVWLTLGSRPNVGRYPTSQNWMYVAQRVTGLFALAFIVPHVWALRGAKLFGTMGAESFYPALTASLSTTRFGFPWTAAGYALGIAACVLHFANGLWGFFFSWGLLGSARARRLAGVLCAALGFVLFTAGAATAFQLATGKSPLGYGVFPGVQGPSGVLDMTAGQGRTPSGPSPAR
jgi:succinate dehydrogenase/fumarate reductase cytochrome b subunit (b558 family)